MNILEMEDWEFGVLQIHNPENTTYKPYFDLVRQSEEVAGDIVEFGVWRGASLITTALILIDLESKKVVHGYDTFAGFPAKSKQDDFKNFSDLHRLGQISESHFERINLNKKHLRASGKDTSVNEISSSLNFSATSQELVMGKIEYFGLKDKIELHTQDVSYLSTHDMPNQISLALLDLDLYQGYESVLPLVWDRLEPGGFIYLDEYYSLKFPGPRIAVDDFAKRMNIKPELICTWMDFERWSLKKSNF